jgi:outer membrane protein insertion porin family
MHYNKKKVAAAIVAMACSLGLEAQERIVYPDITYAGTPRNLTIGGFSVSGMEGYEDYMLTGISGLTVGQQISLPGTEITDAVKRYWKHGLFSDVQISADSIVNDKVYLHIALKPRPRVSTINYFGLKKTEREDMEKKLGILKGGQITPNMIDRAKILAKKYFDDKGYKNADIEINQKDDLSKKNQVILDIVIDKKSKMKVRYIVLEGNEKLKTSRIKGGLFKKGAFAKTHEAGKLSSFLKSKKYTPERWKEDKEKLIEKYNELGYRDAAILGDSVWNNDPKHVNVWIKVSEGQKYFIRKIHWVGNTVYTTEILQRVLGMNPGDVYNQKLLDKRLKSDEDAVGNLYYNHGYVFSNIDPVEQNIEGDSIDLEMRVQEGPQAHLSHVRIYGNNRLYENVVRRELRTKPGDLFSKDAIMRSYREIASMGHFDPEKINPDVKPDYESGTVDLNWMLEQKSNDQIEFSLGWGQTGVIGRIGLTLNNFSMANLFRKNKEHRGIMPIGDGEKLSISAQTNGTYYQSYNATYSTNWFGGKRPNQLSVGVYYSKQTDINSNYYNQSAYSNYYYNLYGYNSYGYNYSNYENYYDPDKYIQLFGASLGWGKRLRWPDDYFTLSVQAAYTRYMLKNWRYFYLMTNGNANNLNFSISISRASTDNQLYPRTGSEFSASVTLTPPWSLWDGKDYKNLATNSNSPTYVSEQKIKYKWIEYHKWSFKSKTYTALTNGQKCLVLMTRADLGLLGNYNKYKESPFETFYMGGDGMSGYSSYAGEETIGLRGYENGSIAYNGYAYDRFTLELRYPFLLGNTTIYGLTFLEGGNAWSKIKQFNPFDMKRSAGVGVRIYLPMVGLMGIDWGYGFDKDNTNNRKGGSQFHFVLGQEF